MNAYITYKFVVGDYRTSAVMSQLFSYFINVIYIYVVLAIKVYSYFFFRHRLKWKRMIKNKVYTLTVL